MNYIVGSRNYLLITCVVGHVVLSYKLRIKRLNAPSPQYIPPLYICSIGPLWGKYSEMK